MLTATAPEVRAEDAASVLAKATLSAARRLGLTNRDLAVVLGASEASVSRLARDRALRPGSAETSLALLFVRLFRSLDAITGGDEAKARAWFTAFNRHLGGAPAERIRSTEGLVNVVQYLDAIRGKL
ncbi:MAG TPA: MbcA/ParS/Xre antitoxin family protein [Vicinamibacterales bacterium]|jgi:transcriptional regulator with XRE-family HTH domain|nr:MbcA/ParS/Xre antitoxin family protein [Vicinamibacterales bacterium]